AELALDLRGHGRDEREAAAGAVVVDGRGRGGDLGLAVKRGRGEAGAAVLNGAARAHRGVDKAGAISAAAGERIEVGHAPGAREKARREERARVEAYGEAHRARRRGDGLDDGGRLLKGQEA